MRAHVGSIQLLMKAISCLDRNHPQRMLLTAGAFELVDALIEYLDGIETEVEATIEKNAEVHVRELSRIVHEGSMLSKEFGVSVPSHLEHQAKKGFRDEARTMAQAETLVVQQVHAWFTQWKKALATLREEVRKL
jgi:hypothetical protein